MYSMLKSKNNGLARDVVEFARGLVRVPSASYHEAEVAEIVERRMRAIGYDKVFRDGSGNVVGVIYGREAKPVLLMNGHLDTAAPGAESQWNDAIHSGRSEGGMLYGLGASDCKGGLAAQVYVGALLRRSLLPLRGTLVVAGTVAEETGGSPGVRALVGQTLKELELKPTYAMLADPTDLGLYYGHDGCIEMEVCVQGANPFHVQDAARAIVSGIGARETIGAESEAREFQAVRPPEFADAEGTSRALIRMVRRLLPAEKEDDILCETRRSASVLAQSAGAVAVEVGVRKENRRLYTGHMTVVRHVTHAWATDPFHPLVERSRQALAAAGCEVRPGKWALGRLGMGTAGSALLDEFGIPTVGYGPGDETRCHAPNESVSEARIVEAVYGATAIAHALIGVPVCGWTSDEI